VSLENVGVVRGALDAFSRRDLEATVGHYAAEIEVDWSRSPGVEAGVYQGSEAVRRFLSTFFEAFDRIAVTPDDFIVHGDHVVVPHHVHFWGRDGIRVDARGVLVHTLRGGRIVRLELYRERDEALRAVALEE
jgi:ketosteroid isomerase-like protein